MPISAKRKLAAGAAGLAVLAGAGGAYAAGQSSPPPKPVRFAAEQKAFLDDVAKRLNVPRDQLDAAIKGAAQDRIDAAVAAGRLTKEQGDAAKKRLQSGAPLLGPGGFGGPPPGGPGPHGRFGGPGPFFGGLDGAAGYLGLTEPQLRDQLHSGKSLADIAKATSGKTVDGLEAAIKDAMTKRLDQAVKDGHLTSAQRDKIAAELDEHLDDVVNATPPAGAPGPRGLKRRWR